MNTDGNVTGRRSVDRSWIRYPPGPDGGSSYRLLCVPPTKAARKMGLTKQTQRGISKKLPCKGFDTSLTGFPRATEANSARRVKQGSGRGGLNFDRPGIRWCQF